MGIVKLISMGSSIGKSNQELQETLDMLQIDKPINPKYRYLHLMVSWSLPDIRFVLEKYLNTKFTTDRNKRRLINIMEYYDEMYVDKHIFKQTLTFGDKINGEIFEEYIKSTNNNKLNLLEFFIPCIFYGSDTIKNKLTFLFPFFNCMDDDVVDNQEFYVIFKTFINAFRCYSGTSNDMIDENIKEICNKYFNMIDTDFSNTLDTQEIVSQMTSMYVFTRMFDAYECTPSKYNKNVLKAPITDFIVFKVKMSVYCNHYFDIDPKTKIHYKKDIKSNKNNVIMTSESKKRIKDKYNNDIKGRRDKFKENILETDGRFLKKADIKSIVYRQTEKELYENINNLKSPEELAKMKMDLIMSKYKW